MMLSTSAFLFSVLAFAAPSEEAPPTDVPSEAAGLVERLEDGSVVYGGLTLRNPNDVEAVVFSTDSKSLWVSFDETIAHWDIETGQQLSSFAAPCADYGASSLAVSPDGQQLAVGCDYDSLKIINTKGQVAQVFEVKGATNLQWSGRVLAGSVDEELVLWSIKKGKELARMDVGYFSTWSGKNDQWVVAGVKESGSDRELIVGLNKKGKERWRVPVDSQSGFAWSKDGETVAVVMNGNLSLRSTDKGDEVQFFETDYGILQVLAVDHGWWILSNEKAHRFDADLKPMDEVALSSNGLLSSPSGEWIIDTDGARPRVFTSKGVQHLADQGLSEEADTIVAAGDLLLAYTDNEAVVVVRSTGEHHTIAYSASAAAVAPDGQQAALAGEGVILIAPDGTTREVTGMGEYTGFDLLTFSKDGRWLWALSSSMEAFVTQIDVEKAQILHRRKVADQMSAGAVALSDGSGFVLPMEDGRLMVVPLED